MSSHSSNGMRRRPLHLDRCLWHTMEEAKGV